MTHWALVTVTEQARRGRKKLLTFQRMSGATGSWVAIAPPQSFGEIKRHGRPATITQGAAIYVLGERFPVETPPPTDRRGPVAAGTELVSGAVPLTDDFRPPAAVLSTVLDALASDERMVADVGDLKAVVSELSPMIKKFRHMPVAARRHAQAALYTEILRRCSTLC